MSSLPFVIAPREHQARRVGTLDSGVLEIPILGGLTVAESATISELVAGDVNVFVHGAQLADAMAQAEDISQAEAFAIVEQVMSAVKLDGKAEEIRIRYAERLEALAVVYAATGQRNIEASVTAILRHRLNLPNWSMEDTRKLPRVLLQDIWQLVIEEQNAENMPTNRPTDEDLKKQLPVSGKRRAQTGKASSGGFATATQEPLIEPPSVES